MKRRFAADSKTLVGGPLCALAWLWMGGALAKPTETLPRTEVTGSHLKRAEDESIAPMQVMARAELERSAAKTVSEALQLLLPNAGVATENAGRDSAAPGAASIGLRFLDSNATLVLLNSRRVAPYPLMRDNGGIFTNIDTLPLEAVERIEVLKGGASSIYGSEAIAGVINIITRPEFEGLVLNAQRERSSHSGSFGSRRATLSFGHGSWARNGFNLFSSLEFTQRDSVIWRNVLPYINPVYFEKFPNLGSFSSYSAPGNLIGSNPRPLPGCAKEFVIGGLCRYDRYERFEAMPRGTRVNLYNRAQWRLDGGQEAFAELLLADNRTQYLSPFQPYGSLLGAAQWLVPATGEVRTFTYRGLPVSHPLNTLGESELEVRTRFIDAQSQANVHTRQYRALTGLRGAWRGFDWEASLGQMGGTTRLAQRGSFSVSGFVKTIGNFDPAQTDPLFFNRGYQIGQANDPNVVDALFPAYGYAGRTTQQFIDARLNGAVAQLPAGAVELAAGLELRHERFTVTPSANLLAGDIIGNGLNSVDAGRQVAALFAELGIPLHAGVHLDAAARIDKYGAFAAHVSPKLGMRLEPSSRLTIRGSVEGGFRAPNLVEAAGSSAYGFAGGLYDPKRCPQARRLIDDLRKAAAPLADADPQKLILAARADNLDQMECHGTVASLLVGNPALHPETARSISLGLVFKPMAGVSIGLDYWAIRRRNEIGQKNPHDLIAAEDQLDRGVIQRNPLAQDRSFSVAERAVYGVTAGSMQLITARYENGAGTKVSGLDLSLLARSITALGRFDFSLNLTRNLDYRQYSTVLGRYGDNLVDHAGISKIMTVLSASLQHGGLTHALTYTYMGRTTLWRPNSNTLYTPEDCASRGWSADQCMVGATKNLDYSLAYRAVKGLTLTAYVRNLLNRHQGLSLGGLDNGGGGILPQDNRDPAGRMVGFRAEYRFF